MIRRMKPYAATAWMCVREQGYFGYLEFAANYLQRFIGLAALLFIWRVLFSQGADTGGMTLSQILGYTWVSHMLSPMLDVRTPASSWMHEGTLQSQFQRPMGIFGQLGAHTIGGWVMPFFLFTVPLSLLAPLFGVSLIPQSLWFFPSFALAVSLGFAVDFLFACLLMRLKNLPWTIHAIRGALNGLLNGSLFPLALFPWGLGKYLELTPFSSMAGAPLALFAGMGDAALLVCAQLFWNILLWPLAIWGFARSRERMVSYGG